MAQHDENVVWHAHPVTQQQREQHHGHRGVVLWFTGLSGSGKSTVAGALEEALHERGVSTYLLDGDNVRHGLCSDLGFSDEDRKENIRRVGEVARLMVDAGLVVLTAPRKSPCERHQKTFCQSQRNHRANYPVRPDRRTHSLPGSHYCSAALHPGEGIYARRCTGTVFQHRPGDYAGIGRRGGGFQRSSGNQTLEWPRYAGASGTVLLKRTDCPGRHLQALLQS